MDIDLGDGNVATIPDEQWNAMSEDQRATFSDRITMEMNKKATADAEGLASDKRVNTAARRINETRHAMETIPGQGMMGAIQDEITTGMLANATDHISALSSYPGTWIQDAFGIGDNPHHGLAYTERRDAERLARDINADKYMPEGVQTALNIGGLVMNPLSAAGAGSIPLSAGAGAVMGGIEGALGSEATSLSNVLADAATNAAVGGAAGAGGELLFRGARKGAQKLFGRAGSAQTLDDAVAAGVDYDPSLVGNDMIRRISNAVAQAPIASTASRALPGKSLADTMAEQVQQTGAKFDDLNTSGGTIHVEPTDAGLGGHTQRAAKEATDRMKQENRVLDRDVFNTSSGHGIDPMTPTPIPGFRTAGDDLRAAGHSEAVWGADAAQAEIDKVLKNDMYRTTPGATALDSQAEALDQSIDSLRRGIADGTVQDVQVAKRQIKNQTRQRDRLLARRDQEVGPTVRAALENRSRIGKATEYGNFEDSTLYGKLTDDIRSTIAREEGSAGVMRFDNMKAQQKNNLINMKLIKHLTKGKKKGKAGEAIAMATGGNIDEFIAVTSKMTKEELDGMTGNIFAALGRGGKDEPWSAANWAGNWRMIPDENKALMIPDPQKRELYNSIARISEELTQRGKLDNHSNSTVNAGTLAMLAGIFTGAGGKTAAIIGGLGGMDRFLKSKALARAIAGKPADLDARMKSLLTGGAIGAQGDSEMDFNEDAE